MNYLIKRNLFLNSSQ